MMRAVLKIGLTLVAVAFAGAAFGQQQPVSAPHSAAAAPPAAPAAGADADDDDTTPKPSAEAMKLARTLAGYLDTGSAKDKPWLVPAIENLLRQMEVVQRDWAKAVVDDGIFPVLDKHKDELLDAEADAYAETLSLDDLKGAVAFFGSPAGQAMLKARPAVLQYDRDAVDALFTRLKPEFAAKVKDVMKAKGWTN
jgi:hypothetical protein